MQNLQVLLDKLAGQAPEVAQQLLDSYVYGSQFQLKLFAVVLILGILSLVSGIVILKKRVDSYSDWHIPFFVAGAFFILISSIAMADGAYCLTKAKNYPKAAIAEKLIRGNR